MKVINVCKADGWQCSLSYCSQLYLQLLTLADTASVLLIFIHSFSHGTNIFSWDYGCPEKDLSGVWSYDYVLAKVM